MRGRNSKAVSLGEPLVQGDLRLSRLSERILDLEFTVPPY